MGKFFAALLFAVLCTFAAPAAYAQQQGSPWGGCMAWGCTGSGASQANTQYRMRGGGGGFSVRSGQPQGYYNQRPGPQGYYDRRGPSEAEAALAGLALGYIIGRTTAEPQPRYAPQQSRHACPDRAHYHDQRDRCLCR